MMFLLFALLCITSTPAATANTPQETIDHLVQLHATYREVPPDSLGQKDIQAIIDTLTEAHELAHTSSYQDHVDLTRMISDITDWLMDMSDTLEPELATAVRSCCSQKCFKCLIVDTLIVRNKAYLPNGSGGSCAPCSSLDQPNTIALRDTTGSFALNNLSADGNITLTKNVDQSPSGIIYMDGVPALWTYPNGSNLSIFIGAAGSTTSASYISDIAIGQGALANSAYVDTTGNGNNIAIGSNVMGLATRAQSTVAIGNFSLQQTTFSSFDTVIGCQAYKDYVLGSANVVIGHQAAVNTTGGDSNVIIGEHAYSHGTAKSGSLNIIIGSQAGNNYTGGESQNILIGDPGETGDFFVCRIGNIATQGVTGAAVLVSPTNQLGIATSSKRFKTNIADLPNSALDVIAKLHPVQFNYLTKDGGAQETISHGLIAEEVAEVDDTLVVYGEDGLPLTVKYHEMDAYYIAALQYVMKENSELRQELAAIKAHLNIR